MKELEQYKDSNIEWLGSIPQHWQIKRIKDLGYLQNGVSKGKEYFGFGNPFISYGNVYNDKIELKYVNTYANSSIDEQKLYSVKEGDVLFTRTSETIEEIGIAAISLETIPKSTFSGFVIRLRTNGKIIHKYFSNYYFRAYINRIYLSKETNIVTRASLGQNTLYNLPVILPPIEEQILIGRYLDSKTQLIDKKIELLYKKIDTYKELRKALINKAVCQGLNDSVKLKDSGIDWIGKIPEYWDSNRLKDKFDIYTGNSISDKTFYENSTNGLPYIATKDIDIDQGNIDYENGMFIPDGKLKEFKISHKNSSLICIEGASAGKKIGFNIQKSCFVNKLCSIKSKDKFGVDKYLYYQLQSDIWTNQFFAVLNGMIGGVSVSTLKSFHIVIPPAKEQVKIVRYLDEQTNNIDCITNNIYQQIKRLQELRKTLINDVVTGKIKVTE